MRASGNRTKDPVRVYECVVCPEKSPDYRSFSRHLKTHEPKPSDPRLISESQLPNGRFLCLICGKEMKTKRHLRGHLLTHSPRRIFRCPKCPRIFQATVLFLRHLKTHDRKKFRCKFCDKKFLFLSSRYRHLKNVHKESSKDRCEVCFKMVNKYHLQIHYFLHTEERPYECGLCEKRFPHRHVAYAHVKSVHPRSKYPDIIHDLSNQSTDSGELKARHVDGSTKTCDNCSITFGSHLEYVVHVTLGHMAPSECPEGSDDCVPSPTGGTLGTHEQQHAGASMSGTRGSYKCIICPKMLNTPSGFIDHLRDHSKKLMDPRLLSQAPCHNGGYECLVCGEMRSSLSRLQRHLCTHVAMKTFQCPLCSRWFKAHHNFLCHLGLHAQNRVTCRCTICSKELCSKYRLAIHMKTVHSKDGGKERCEVCFKMITKKGLLTHYYVHTGERSCKCMICGKEMSTPDVAMHHVKRSHPELKEPSEAVSRCMGLGEIGKQRVVPRDEAMRCVVCKMQCNGPRDYVVHSVMGHPNTTPSTEKSVTQESLTGKGVHDEDCTFEENNTRKTLPYKCIVCPEKFQHSSELIKHVHGHNPKPRDPSVLSNAELPDGRFQCPVCEQVLNAKYSLANHFKIHCEVVEFPCPKCPASFSSSNTFFQHLGTHAPTTSKGYRCHCCGLSVPSYSKLRAHSRRMHYNGSEGFRCEVCYKFQYNQNSLLMHYYSHTKECLYACNICKTRYISKCGAIRHIKRKHPKVKPPADFVALSQCRDDDSS